MLRIMHFKRNSKYFRATHYAFDSMSLSSFGDLACFALRIMHLFSPKTRFHATHYAFVQKSRPTTGASSQATRVLRGIVQYYVPFDFLDVHFDPGIWYGELIKISPPFQKVPFCEIGELVHSILGRHSQMMVPIPVSKCNRRRNHLPMPSRWEFQARVTID